MPRRAVWRRDGTSESPKPIDLRLPGLGRLQLSSGVLHKTAWENRRNAIKEAWALGGIWADSVRGLAAGRFDVSAWYTAKAAGEDALRTLLNTKGAEPLVAVVRDYLRQVKAKDSAKMRQRLHRFVASLGAGAVVTDVTPAAIEAFLNGLIDHRTRKTTKTPAKGSTANRYRAVLSGFATWAVRNGRMTAHPIRGKQVVKREEPHHRLPELSADEYRDYMAAARAARADLAVVLLLLVHTAPDVGELFDAIARDVDLETGRIRYERPKTQRYGPAPRFVPMPSIVVVEVRAHVAEHGVRGSQKLFGMLRRRDVEWLHDRAARAIQRPELTMKDLRHVAAIAWVKAGVHIRLVQRWLGHRSLAMTMKYTDYEPDAAMAVEMAERAAQTLNRSSDVTPLRAAGGIA
jgi:integrase